MLQVPKAKPNRIKLQVLSSNPKIEAQENEANTHKAKLSKTLTLTVNFPANFLYAGFATFTMLVMIVDITINPKIMFVIIIYYKNIKLINQ